MWVVAMWLAVACSEPTESGVEFPAAESASVVSDLDRARDLILPRTGPPVEREPLRFEGDATEIELTRPVVEIDAQRPWGEVCPVVRDWAVRGSQPLLGGPEPAAVPPCRPVHVALSPAVKNKRAPATRRELAVCTTASRRGDLHLGPDANGARVDGFPRAADTVAFTVNRRLRLLEPQFKRARLQGLPASTPWSDVVGLIDQASREGAAWVTLPPCEEPSDRVGPLLGPSRTEARVEVQKRARPPGPAVDLGPGRPNLLRSCGDVLFVGAQHQTDRLDLYRVEKDQIQQIAVPGASAVYGATCIDGGVRVLQTRELKWSEGHERQVLELVDWTGDSLTQTRFELGPLWISAHTATEDGALWLAVNPAVDRDNLLVRVDAEGGGTEVAIGGEPPTNLRITSATAVPGGFALYVLTGPASAGRAEWSPEVWTYDLSGTLVEKRALPTDALGRSLVDGTWALTGAPKGVTFGPRVGLSWIDDGQPTGRLPQTQTANNEGVSTLPDGRVVAWGRARKGLFGKPFPNPTASGQGYVAVVTASGVQDLAALSGTALSAVHHWTAHDGGNVATVLTEGADIAAGELSFGGHESTHLWLWYDPL